MRPWAKDEESDVDEYMGSIKLFAGNYAPRGWAICDGRLLPIRQWQALFAILGTQYGGDGRVTFALPKLAGPNGEHQPPYYIICVQGYWPSRD